MKKLIALLVLVGLSGCASQSKLTTARITLNLGGDIVEITQPKDTQIGFLTYSPLTKTITISNYVSAANVDALKSGDAQAAGWMTLFQAWGAMAGQKFGMTPAPQPTPPLPTNP